MFKATKSLGKVEQSKRDQELQGGDAILNGVVRASLTEKAELSHIFCDPSCLAILCHYAITQIKNCLSGNHEEMENVNPILTVKETLKHDSLLKVYERFAFREKLG